MKRRVVRITLLILIGVIVNFLMALRMANPSWGRSDIGNVVALSETEAELLFLDLLREHFPEEVGPNATLQDFVVSSRPPFDKPDAGGIVDSAPGMKTVRLSITPDVLIDSKTVNQGLCVEVGWPFPCLSGTILTKSVGGFLNPVLLHNQLIIPNMTYLYGGDRVYVPYKPLWVGLIANSLLYGLVGSGIIAVIMLFRRHWRLERVCCPHCNYDLHPMMKGDGITCPECGQFAKHKAFDVPVVIVRPWMLVSLLLPALWLVCWILDLHMPPKVFLVGPPEYWMLHPYGLIFCGLICAGFCSAAFRSYRGRQTSQRYSLSLAMGLGLGIACYASVIYLLDFVGISN